MQDYKHLRDGGISIETVRYRGGFDSSVSFKMDHAEQ